MGRAPRYRDYPEPLFAAPLRPRTASFATASRSRRGLLLVLGRRGPEPPTVKLGIDPAALDFAPPKRGCEPDEKSPMKIFFDFLPVLLFFGTFKYAEGNAEWAARFASQHLGFFVSGGVVGTEEAPVLLATVVVILA